MDRVLMRMGLKRPNSISCQWLLAAGIGVPNSSRVVCHYVRKCFQKEYDGDGVTIEAGHVIQLELQEGDWLVLQMNISVNSSYEETTENIDVVLDPVPEREAVSCNLAVFAHRSNGSLADWDRRQHHTER
ncbi:delta and Notch-like epidermal growth factor-related receptor [Caerostris extrusa]|uniref:Delta and Notch-like epidermal growth factor-related receptor n=1 Tax=Caerostris extrusa TaxID=172846 RepID=A0AAV4VDK6_CAEEX|nr:delta and Notch-like epidermal growth factor-related receptor [Caerostris extrusa]